MRDTFVKELDMLDQGVVRMGALVEASLQEANLALAENDVERARRVMEGDDAIDAMFMSVEQQALVILAQQAPVARDLRLIIITLRAANELERTGDLAHNIAQTVVRNPELARPKTINSLIYDMGQAAIVIMGRALDAWAAKDVEIATEVTKMDDQIDALYKRLFAEMVQPGSPPDFESAMHLILVGRWLERIADHAVNIAEGIRFYVTGDTELLG